MFGNLVDDDIKACFTLAGLISTFLFLTELQQCKNIIIINYYTILQNTKHRLEKSDKYRINIQYRYMINKLEILVT